jgi:hypothetical protein
MTILELENFINYGIYAYLVALFYFLLYQNLFSLFAF